MQADVYRRTYAVERPRVARRRGAHGRAALAAFLSFLFPGFGQFYNGQLGWGAALFLPLMPLVGAAVVLAVNGNRIIGYLFDTRILIALIALNLALFGWRLVGILQAHLRRASLHPLRLGTYGTVLLAVITIGMHALPTWYAAKAVDTLTAVAAGGEGGGGDSPRSAYPELLGPDEQPLPEPTDQPDVVNGERVNILVIGIDEAPGRGTLLTDTMIVLSFDSDTGTAAMISIPRDLFGAPMPGGGTYDDKLNSLLAVATYNPGAYPLGGVGTLKATISELLGIPIHYFAAINLLGFKQAIDTIGGVDVPVERAVDDPAYIDEYGEHVGFSIQPGLHHLDGRTALAFVRSRYGVGDNDFTRAARQQQVLAAIYAKLGPENLLIVLPGLLDAMGNTLATDVPSDRIGELVQVIEAVDMSALHRVVLEPPTYVTPGTGPGGTYILIPNVPAIRETAGQIAGD